MVDVEFQGNGIHQGKARKRNTGQMWKPKTVTVDPTGVPVDRMVHYQDTNKRLEEINHYIRTGQCPECGNRPVGCINRVGGNMFCRVCGHHWGV